MRIATRDHDASGDMQSRLVRRLNPRDRSFERPLCSRVIFMGLRIRSVQRDLNASQLRLDKTFRIRRVQQRSVRNHLTRHPMTFERGENFEKPRITEGLAARQRDMAHLHRIKNLVDTLEEPIRRRVQRFRYMQRIVAVRTAQVARPGEFNRQAVEGKTRHGYLDSTVRFAKPSKLEIAAMKIGDILESSACWDPR